MHSAYHNHLSRQMYEQSKSKARGAQIEAGESGTWRVMTICPPGSVDIYAGPRSEIEGGCIDR